MNVEKLYPGSSSWDDLGNEPSFGGTTRDSEARILVDMGIDTSVDSDSSSDSDTAEFASTVDVAMREAFNLCLGVDLLDSAGHTGSNAPD